MADNVLCHMLIGPAGSGKSTLAQQMQQWFAHSHIVSTDRIRRELYGDEAHQGHWPEIEAIALRQIHDAVAAGRSVIYDATNARRPWRMALLTQLQPFAPCWVGWQLKTPLKTCHQWNQQRDRQVPTAVINDQHTALQQFPPLTAEGFWAVYSLPVPPAIEQIEAALKRLTRSRQNRLNRTHHQQITWHRYSTLLDFDRLMHLISLLVQYPGLGDWHHAAPERLQTLIGSSDRTLTTALEEIAVVMAQQRGALYADARLLAQDLAWLDTNGILSVTPTDTPLAYPPTPHDPVNPHPYSDWDAFQRLLLTIRFISHHPFHWNAEQKSSLDSLITEMQRRELLIGEHQAAIRKDFERVLKPFRILPPFRLRRGYFIGTGILTESELLQTASLLQAQAKNIQDPLALSLLDTLQQRLQRSQHDLDSLYPVRAIANRMIINPDLLPAESLARYPETIADDIEAGQLLELKRYRGVGRFDDEPDEFFRAWPLQLVFRNIAWYLSYELADGPEAGLLQFERLDRLFRGLPQPQQRSLSAQRHSLQRLHRLQSAGGGLYLGRSVQLQQQFLSTDPEQQKAASTQVELWCTDKIFAFISEGTQRFPTDQMQMSVRLNGHRSSHDTLFCLPKSQDHHYPNRLVLTLPVWSCEDIDLRRWIIGFGAEVKVIAPPELQQQIVHIAQKLSVLYQN
ncbi:AAA family ATPase [Halomicronema sp. CCY15110]|uniref:AAA family ATPase n=1 Tax=Halomicronema sp. CCY15110 TaxID=2767773 RepID=UPI00194ED454|nr:AAA family ATPase [Halomicronema sp. CCY15110]